MWFADHQKVTPRAGVWIETGICKMVTCAAMSHPARVCGLKHIGIDYKYQCTAVAYRQELVKKANM